MFQSLIKHIEANAKHVKKTQEIPGQAVFIAKETPQRERLVLMQGEKESVFATLHVLDKHVKKLAIPSLAWEQVRLPGLVVRTAEGEYDTMAIVSWRKLGNYHTIRFDVGHFRFPYEAVVRLANALDLAKEVDEAE
jgi:hypothetical protein